MKLEASIIQILAAATIRDNQLILNSGDLDRKTYEQVNKALEALGGKWNRKLRTHLFESDPTEAVEATIHTGEVVSAKKLFDFFQTPPELAKRIVGIAGVKPQMRVLEPSAGKARIVDALPQNVLLETVELNPVNRRYLVGRDIWPVHDDFLTFEPKEPYDVIVANPPFSRQQDVKHINRMLDLLKPSGRLVSVASQSILYRQNKLTLDFCQRLDQLGAQIEPLPDDTFIEEGTSVRTCLVILA